MCVDNKIKEVYEAHKKSGLYGDSFENVIFKLTNAYDSFYLTAQRELIAEAKSLSLQHEKNNDLDHFDDYRHSYRACIKFVCEDCKHASFDNWISSKDIQNYQQEMRDAIGFNFIRNAIDQYKVSKYSVEVIDGKLCFKRNKSNREFVYELYSRRIADEIPGGKNNKDIFSVADFTLMLLRLSTGDLAFESKKLFKPTKPILKRAIEDLKNRFAASLNADILSLRPATDYSLDQYISVYCYLAAIGVYKTAYLLKLKDNNEHLQRPSILYPKERLISDVSNAVEIDENLVRKIIKDMTYDPDFHKDRITLYQPLFEVGDFFLCSTTMVFFSYVVDKAIKYYDFKGTNKADLSKYHNYMSEKMNHRMAENLPSMYPNLVVFENAKLLMKNMTQAEVDLVLFDRNTKTGALIELKDYAPIDNEGDTKKKDRNINSAIKSRLEKDKRVIDNLELFFEQNDIPKEYLDYQLSSLLVTSSYAGGIDVQEKIKVLDENLFYYLLRIHCGNFKEFLQFVEEGEFFNILNEELLKEGNRCVNYTYKGIIAEVDG